MKKKIDEEIVVYSIKENKIFTIFDSEVYVFLI